MSQTSDPLGQDPRAGRQDAAAPQGLDLSAVRSGRVPASQPGGQAAGAPQGGTPQGGAPQGGAPASAAPGQGAPAGGVQVPSLVIEASEANLESVVQLSTQVPVVVDLGSARSEASVELSAVLARVTEAYGGRVVLARIDVDADPRLPQAFGVQAVPTVVALLAGQPAPLFQGAQPEEQVRQVLDQVLQVAAQQGITGVAVPADGAEPEETGPAHPEAMAAMDAGDLDRAEELYRAALAEAPADEEAKLGVIRVALLRRLADKDPQAVVQAAGEDPTNIDAALDAADAELALGEVEAAFSRLLSLMPTAAPEDKERLRLRLLDLFEIVGPEDARVVKARGRLMRALF